ncbi:GerAB/ArcD/ProY family transporter [Metabacillus sp. FJAT-52054]|uniref:GerAB/ArcD/ProY family transporter n=1 Tax=Metabacillus sediminis TaxID=3117746 RepID=A0ABZ2NF85_9BACI
MNKNLSPFQLYFFIIQTQIGVGILGLPYEVQSEAKGDAWISIVVTGILIQMVITLYWLLAKRNPEKNLFQYSVSMLGGIAGRFINGLYVLYGITVMVVILVFAVGIIKDWVLDETPRWIIVAMLCLVGVYLGKEEAEVIAKFHVIVSGLIILLLVITVIALFSYPLDFRYLLPLSQSGWKEISMGITKAYFSMIGFEVLLILYPLVKTKTAGAILKSATWANFTVTGVYTYLTVVCQIVFSPDEMDIIPQPLLYLVKALYIQVVERFDLLFASIWIVNVSTSYVSYLFLSTEGLKTVLMKLKRPYLAYGLCAATFLIALFLKDEKQMYIVNDILLKFSVIPIIVIPSLLLIIGLFFYKKKTKGSM